MSRTIFTVLLGLFVLLTFSFAVATTYTIRTQVVYANGSIAPNATLQIYMMEAASHALTLNGTNSTNSTGFGHLSFKSESGSGGPPDLTSFRVVVSNASDPNNITHIMPPVEAPGVAMEAMFNRSNVTVYPAATIHINATNESIAFNFSGILFDAKTDTVIDNFIEPNPIGGADRFLNRTIVVLRDRNYTLVAIHMGTPGMEYGRAPQSIPIYDTNFTRNSDSLGRFVVTVNFSEAKYFIDGTVSICGSPPNVRYSALWLYPVGAGRVPLFAGILGPNSTSTQLETRALNHLINGQGGIPFSYNITQNSAGSHNGVYNITLSGRPEGLNYVVVILAYNGTSEAAADHYYGAFQNVTVSANMSMNFQLCNLSGAYTLDSSVTGFSGGGGPAQSNTSRFIVYVNNSDSNQPIQNGGALQAVVNLTNGSGNGPVNLVYMMSQNTSGYAMFPVHINTSIELKFFGGQFAPRKYVLNSNAGNATIQVASFKPQTSNGSTKGSIQMQFMTSNASCSVPEPPPGCRIGNFENIGAGGSSFKPSEFNRKGELVNVRLLDPSGSGTIFYFIGVDMFASGPPDFAADNPTDVASGTSAQRTARVGSAAPGIFQYAYVGLPYVESTVDENADIKLLLRNLYDESWNNIWNSTSDPNATSVPTRFTDYPNSTLLFNFSAGGLTCSKTDVNATSSCYASTGSNFIWVKVPHFSGSDMQVSGTSLATASSGTVDEYAQDDLDLSAEFQCPANELEVTATSKSKTVEGITIKLIDTVTGLKVGSEQTTDDDGQTTFTLSKSGSYRVTNSVKKKGYVKADPITVDVELCAEQGVASVLTPVPEPAPAPAPSPAPAPAPTSTPGATVPAPTPVPVPTPVPSSTTSPAPTPAAPEAPAVQPTPTVTAGGGGLNLFLIGGVLVVVVVALVAVYFYTSRAGKK